MSDTQLQLRCGLMFALVALLGHAIVKAMGLAPVGVDDANILFVYSQHFAAGEGLVYNVGGERVEGFSSMLWMLLTAIGYLFSSQPYPLFFAFNLLLIGAALGYTLHFVEEQFAPQQAWNALSLSLPGMLFLVWAVTSPAYVLWTIASLMETGLWSALLIAGTVHLLSMAHRGATSGRDIRLFSALCAALILTRPEGVAWVLSLLTLLALVQRSQGASAAELARGVGVAALCSGLTWLLLLGFRLSYFGFLWPNTYYVKVTPDKFYNLRFGLIYLLQFVQASGFATVFILAALVSALRNLPGALRLLLLGVNTLTPQRTAEFCLACVVLVGLLLPILMGGDIFGAFRFFQPTWPLLILTLFYLAPPQWWSVTLPRALTAAGLALVACTLTLNMSWPTVGEDRARVRHLFELSARGIATGQLLEQTFADSARGLPVVGLSAAGGKIGYRGEVIDTMGLNFLPMAHHDGDKKGTRGHAAFDKQVFWTHAPELLEPTLCPLRRDPVNRSVEPDNWLFEIYRGLFADAAFREQYRFAAITVPDAERKLCSYVNVTRLAELRAAGTPLTVIDYPAVAAAPR